VYSEVDGTVGDKSNCKALMKRKALTKLEMIDVLTFLLSTPTGVGERFS